VGLIRFLTHNYTCLLSNYWAGQYILCQDEGSHEESCANGTAIIFLLRTRHISVYKSQSPFRPGVNCWTAISVKTETQPRHSLCLLSLTWPPNKQIHPKNKFLKLKHLQLNAYWNLYLRQHFYNSVQFIRLCLFQVSTS